MLNGLRRLDARAIGVIYDHCSSDVFRYAKYRLNDDRVAEDIASEVFVRLLEAAQDGRGPQLNLKGWLLTTASHLVTDHLRRSCRRPTEPLGEALADPLAAPPDEFDRRERGRAFQQAYAMLTDEQQMC